MAWARSRAAAPRLRSLDVNATLISAVAQYSPMRPTLVREPFHRDCWVYEERVDGWCILAYKDGDRVRLVSRT